MINHVGVSYTAILVNHLDSVVQVKTRKNSRKGKQEVKQKHAFHQDEIGKKLLLVKITTEYESGVKLDIGFENSKSEAGTVKIKHVNVDP